MLLDTDQDIQRHFDDLLDGKITKDTLLVFGGVESIPDDGFQSYTITDDTQRSVYDYWIIEYRGIKLQFKFVEVHKDEEVETYILLPVLYAGQSQSERKICTMRQLFEVINTYIDIHVYIGVHIKSKVE